MVGRGEVDAELEAETAEECGRYGQVSKCSIVTMPEGRGGLNDEEAVRIFVQFLSADSAERAVQALHGRFFAKRRVSCRLFPEQSFMQGRLM